MRCDRTAPYASSPGRGWHFWSAPVSPATPSTREKWPGVPPPNAQIDAITAVAEQLLAPWEEQLQQAESMPGWAGDGGLPRTPSPRRTRT